MPRLFPKPRPWRILRRYDRSCGAHRPCPLARRIRAGTVWINTHSMNDASLPIGGMKQSGWGRDSGVGALDNYLETKTVCAVV